MLLRRSRDPMWHQSVFFDDLDRFSSRLSLVWVPLGLPFWPPNRSRDTPGFRKNRKRWCIVDTASQSAFRCGSRLAFCSENIVNNESAARAHYRSFGREMFPRGVKKSPFDVHLGG